MIWVLYARFSAGRRKQKAIVDVFREVCADIRARRPDTDVRIDEVGSKKELIACAAEITHKGALVTEWHAVGFGTPYGPLLGAPEWPEEMSALEWPQLKVPFANGAQAWFYMEGSETWLAPYIATVYRITAYGYQHLAKTGVSTLQAFPPGYWSGAAGYDPVAALYAEAFSDISVRRDECRWLEKKLRQLNPQRLLDFGCGNGALLARLHPLIGQGVGVDISQEAVRLACEKNKGRTNLSFNLIDGLHLPYADQAFDVIVSMLSFRYLDWDPVIEEMKRVLAPGGHILIVDMLAASTKLRDTPFLTKDKLKNLRYLRKHKSYEKALRLLVTHPDWKRMIERHPMHLSSEFTWYLESRFPGGTMKVLNTGVKARILAFDTGPVV
jgi:ubiquinone/menaquinone biosynthesis C-methylase UbiE